MGQRSVGEAEGALYDAALAGDESGVGVALDLGAEPDKYRHPLVRALGCCRCLHAGRTR
jgi:hypothetical protein